MGFLKNIRQTIEMADFFNSTQMLRYDNQNQYRTLTGGILSVGIIITIIIGFANMILSTLQQTSITSTETVTTLPDPSSMVITASPDNNFMFAIEIWRHNLSSPTRYFDITFLGYASNAGVGDPISLPLESCTKEHWSSMPDVVNNFDKLGMSGWMCPPIGSHYQLAGKYTSDYYTEHVFKVGPCNNATDPNRPCAPQADIDQLFVDNGDWFYFNFYYINTILNPNKQAYKTLYLQDTAYVTFGSQLGVEATVYFSDFTIETDYSIWPFTAIEEDKGFMTTSQPRGNTYSIDKNAISNDTYYVTYTFVKSFQSFAFDREVQKISNVFSFMGGLIGALMAGLFVINTYTSFAFEISIAMEIFKKESNESQSQQTPKVESPVTDTRLVNFVKFVGYYWYVIRRFFKGNEKGSDLQHLYQCRKEILKQLDIKSLIKRMIFLQYSLTHIFSEDQLESLQAYKPTQPLVVRKFRRRVENINSQDLPSDSSDKSSQDEVSDMIEPKGGLSMLFSNSKVYPLNSQTIKENIGKVVQTGREMNKVVMQSVSDISSEGGQMKKRFNKKKVTRIKALIESANGGNQISKRIWESIKQIEQSHRHIAQS